MRARLGRLIDLHGDYLEPVLGLVDIGGEFHQVCERIAVCCAAMAADSPPATELSVRQDASTTARDVVWLRRGTLRRAHEASRELGPLCEAAVRESAIARGVNRALEAIVSGRWDVLNLHIELQVVIDRDGPLVADRAAAAFAATVRQYREEPAPLLEERDPELMDVPWSAATLLAELEGLAEVSDVLEWICERVGRQAADAPAGLFHDLLELVPEGFVAREEERRYAFASLDVDARVWAWRTSDNG